MGFLGKLWRGEVSLFTSYWIFGGLVWFMFQMFELTTLVLTNSITSLGFWIGLFYYGFISVAIWRSSIKYTGPRFYAIFAQLTVLGGWFRYLWIIFVPDLGFPS
ncbi:MAG: hypothetical protein V3R64_06355 [Sphingomonadales bacterium]